MGLAIWSLAVFSFATFAYDLIRTGNFDMNWVLIWAVTYLEVLLLAIVAIAVIPRSCWKTTGRGLAINLSLAAILGAIKNPTVYLMAVMLGIEESAWDPFLRIAGGMLLTFLIFVIFVTLLSSRVAHKQLMAKLQCRYLELDEYRNQIPQTTTQAKLDLISETKNTLIPKLGIISGLLKERGEIKPVIANLQDLIENSVRPLSKAFQQQAEQLSEVKQSVKSWNAGYKFPQSVRLRENISISATLALALPAIAFIFYMSEGLKYWQLMSAGMILLCVTLIFCKYISPKNKLVPKRRGAVMIAAVILLTPIPATTLLLFELPDGLSAKGLIVGSVFVISAISVAMVIWINVLDDARGALEIENQSINEKIALELAVFNQTLWLQKRRWGYLLHGKVQSNLTAALARLRSLEASTTGDATQEGMLIELVRQDLNRAADALNSDTPGSVNLSQELTNIQESWRGVVDTSIQISDRAQRALDKSDNLRMSLVEICREAVSNAHRHGSATTMTIQIDRPEDVTLLLTCTNNGSEPTSSSGGMGTQMMDALTVEWSLEYKKTAGLTVLSARLPISNL